MELITGVRAGRCALAVFSAVALFACSGSDGDGVSGGDASALDTASSDAIALRQCPLGSPTPPEEQLGPCCYHRANGDRLAAPKFRIAGLDFSQPQSLAQRVLASVTASAVDEERFNWLWTIEGADSDGAITIRSGSGTRNADGSFTFTSGGETIPWEPVTFAGTIEGARFQGGPARDPVAVIVFGTQGSGVDAELPISALTVERAVMSEERSCIGQRMLTSFDTSEGELSGFVTLEDAEDTSAGFGGSNPIPLCMVLLGLPARSGRCADIPRAEWPFLPDSLCGASGCVASGCDGLTTCNAWAVRGTFAAQGVEVQ